MASSETDNLSSGRGREIAGPHRVSGIIPGIFQGLGRPGQVLPLARANHGPSGQDLGPGLWLGRDCPRAKKLVDEGIIIERAHFLSEQRLTQFWP